MLKKQLPLVALFSLALAGFSSAQVANYTNGSLLMGFNATGGTGVDTSVMVSLGLATSFRDAGSPVLNIVNIGTLLENTYGAGWFEREDLFFGFGTVRSSTGPIGVGLVNGDPSQTVYLSKSRGAVGDETVSGSVINTPTISSVIRVGGKLDLVSKPLLQ